MRGAPPKLHLTRPLCVWADAESCSKSISELLFAAADRRHVTLTLISTSPRHWPNSAFIRSIVVSGSGSVDHRMRQLAIEGDLAISDDEELLQELLERRVHALRPEELAAKLDERLLQMLADRTAAAAERAANGKLPANSAKRSAAAIHADIGAAVRQS